MSIGGYGGGTGRDNQHTTDRTGHTAGSTDGTDGAAGRDRAGTDRGGTASAAGRDRAGTAGAGRIRDNVAADLLRPLTPECVPTDWYLARVRRRHRHSDHSHLLSTAPMTRAELRKAGVTRARLRKYFRRIERGVHVHVDALLPARTASGWLRERRIPAVTLVRAHLLTHPDRIATGFAAGAVYGMRYFVDEERLEFLVPNGGHTDTPPPHLRLSRTRALADHRRRARSPDPRFRSHLCTGPVTTLARMILAVMEQDAARDRRWPVPDLTPVRPHLSPGFIRCVQVSDHLHQVFGAEATGPVGRLAEAGVPADLAAAVLGATDVGAESPPETVLRLAVADLAPGLRSQIPVFRENGTLLTSVDLGWEDRRVHLFYDGGHHLEDGQRDHDSEVLAVLQQDGGRVFRVTAGMIRDVGEVRKLRERVAAALAG